MNHQWKRRFTWVERDEIGSAFLKEPFPARGHRGGLAELRESIRECGIIQPLIARVRDGKLEVICGYRRLLAAQIASIDRVPVIVTRLDDDGAARIFEAENAASWGSGRSLPQAEGRRRARDAHRSPEPAERDAPARSPRQAIASELEISRWKAARPGIESTRERLSDIHGDLVTSYLRVKRDGELRRDELESILDRLLQAAPIRNGLDVREIGVEVSVAGEMSDDDVTLCIATHSLRVAALAQYYGAQLDWSRTATENLTRAALLHDVGMLRIDQSGFETALPLPRDLQKTLHSHTTVGYELVLGSWSEAVAVVARDHHERWDGTGYPDGRPRNEISLPARIVGVLDSYAAMISRRPYRPAYSIGEAIRILEECTVVGLFERAIKDNFLRVFTTLPVGYRGRLDDGDSVQVRDVQISRAKSHLVEVVASERSRRVGQLEWVSPDQVESRVTEITAAPAPSREVVGALADVP